MDHSILARLPREIRDQIYSHALVGIGQSMHQSRLCSPAFYLHSCCVQPFAPSSRAPPPNVFAVTARDHPLLATCRQISEEAFISFLADNVFVQDILVPSLALPACKSLGLFIKGLGEETRLVRRLGLAIEEPDESHLEVVLSYLLDLAGKRNIRPGSLILQIKIRRPTRSPALFSPRGEAWSIAPKDEAILTLTIVVGDGQASWKSFSRAMDEDWCKIQAGTERVLSLCRDLGMSGVQKRQDSWRDERVLWFEEIRQSMCDQFQSWMDLMNGLQSAGVAEASEYMPV